MKISESCNDQSARRRLIRAHTGAEGEADLNGIDYVEVDESQRVLTVFFLGKAPEDVRRRNIVIEGGARIRNIRVERIRLCRIDDPERDDCLKVFVDKAGDFSTYTLKLVNAYDGKPSSEPLDGFDPRYAQIDFSFKANCPADFDCKPESLCARDALPEPEINYLAKDYSSFRQLIFDRLSLIMPQWKERHVPDLGVALVEILAYAGDYLSYYQDAVGTESYLDTARQRISVRRHATLVDYHMHEGCNSRAWVCLEVNTDLTGLDPDDFYFITRAHSFLPPASNEQGSSASRNVVMEEELRSVASNLYEVFEPLVERGRALSFYVEHNRLSFYTWQDTQCCLPRGATSATLKYGEPIDAQPTPPPSDSGYGQTYKQAQQQYGGYDEPAEEPERLVRLKAGDVLIFEEVLGPNTGEPEDADPSHRHAVRLTRVEPDVDRLVGQPIVNIEWSPEDALPFALCISSVGRAPECKLIQDVSVARGNVVLCDNGRTVWSEDSDQWHVRPADEEEAGCVGPREPRETILRAAYFRPVLDQRPLTHGVPLVKASIIARRQSKALGEIMKLVRTLVIERLKNARKHVRLSRAQLEELTTIFGGEHLAQVGLETRARKGRPAQSAEAQAAALERLLGRIERFLEKKRKRLEVLRRRAQAGYALTTLEHEELSFMFGENLLVALGLESDLMLGPASAALWQNPRDAVPHIVVYESSQASAQNNESDSQSGTGERWTPVRNLLGSSGRDRHFVAEVDDEGFAHLRFGNGELGRTPSPGSKLRARYRVGQGRAGNVGAESIAHLVFGQNRLAGEQDVLRVRNPMAARGGLEAEPVGEVKLYAPTAFRKSLQRAITADDYASLAASGNQRSVQQAAASLRWTGSWYEVDVAVDPRGIEEVNDQLFEEVRDSLAPARRMGQDFTVSLARYVPLDIEMLVCVLPQYLRGHVHAALADLFSNRRLPNGQTGFFHPDNLSFGDSIYLSKLVAAAQRVEGVESVTVTRLERLYEGSNHEIEEGVLRLAPLEVARLANDPSFPERGKLLLTMRGGR